MWYFKRPSKKNLPVVFFTGLLCVLMFPLAAQRNNRNNTTSGNDDDDGKKQKVFITAGPEVNLLLPVNFGSEGRGLYGDTLGVFSPQVSFRLGMNVRFDFSRLFSFQTGLYYVNRKYDVRVGVKDAGSGFSHVDGSQTLTYTGFELPLMALFYVQLGREWYMNNAVGFSVDFFPSSVVDTVPIAGSPASNYKVYGGRNSWVIPSAKVAVGFEWRTKNVGYFYLGGQFHRPLIPMFTGFIQKQSLSGQDQWDSHSIRTDVTGTYFAIDFKYFFPPGKKNKFTESRQ